MFFQDWSVAGSTSMLVGKNTSINNQLCEGKEWRDILYMYTCRYPDLYKLHQMIRNCRANYCWTKITGWNEINHSQQDIIPVPPQYLKCYSGFCTKAAVWRCPVFHRRKVSLTVSLVFQWPVWPWRHHLTFFLGGARDCWVEKHRRWERCESFMCQDPINRTWAKFECCRCTAWDTLIPDAQHNRFSMETCRTGLAIRDIIRPFPLRESAAENSIAVKCLGLELWMVMQRALWVQNLPRW